MKRLFTSLAALSAALGMVTVMVVLPSPVCAAAIGLSPTAASASEVRHLKSVNDLKGALESGGRLYVIGNPADVDDYVRAIRRMPNLVLVVVQRSDNHASDAEVLVKALQNSDLVRRQIVDPFTGSPNGVAAVRFDRIENGKGRMDFHTAPRLRKVFTNEAIAKQYAEIRKRGTSVAEALTEVVSRANRAVDADNAATIAATQQMIDSSRTSVQELSAQIAESGFVPLGYTNAMPSDWTNRLDAAEQLLRSARSRDTADKAKAAAATVAKDISRYQELVNRELGGRVLRQRALRGCAALVVLMMILSAALTAQLRRKASAEVEAKKEDIDRALTEVMTLLEQSTFVAINATGEQKREADTLADLNDRLLEQTVALQKYLLAAARVLDAQGLGWIYHHLVPFGARHVAALATGEVTLTVTREEIQRLLNESETLNAAYQLRIGDASDRQLSITDLIGAIEETFGKAQSLFHRLSEADAKLASGIDEIERQGATLVATAIAQSSEATADLFTGAPVIESIIPAVLHSETGHLALAKKAQAHNDAISGIDDHLKPAARIIADGERALTVSAYGAGTLVPAMQRTIELLGAPGSGITTQWVKDAVQTESGTLAELIRWAPYEPIEAGLGEVLQELETLVTDFGDATRVNELRLTSWPATLDAASARVAEGQVTVLAMLRTLGFFASGNPDDLLREHDASPKVLVDAIRQAFGEVVTVLNEGDLEQVRAIEAQIADWFTQIDQLITQSERRTTEYEAESLRLVDAIETSLLHQSKLADSVRTVGAFYSPRSQEQACKDVLGEADSLDGMLQRGVNATAVAQQLGDSAKGDMQRGFVLTAGATLDDAQQRADSALAILVGLPATIALLEAKVTESVAELSAITDRSNSLVAEARQSGVRTATKRALDKVRTSLASVGHSVATAPYEALESLGECKKRLQQIDEAIANDLKLFNEIATTLKSARALERTAKSAIAQAQRASFAHATVNLSDANSSWNDYSVASSSADSALRQEDYEAALTEAQRAFREVSSVEQLASDAVSAAERAHEAHEVAMASYTSTEDRGGYADFISVSDSDGSADYSGVSD